MRVLAVMSLVIVFSTVCYSDDDDDDANEFLYYEFELGPDDMLKFYCDDSLCEDLVFPCATCKLPYPCNYGMLYDVPCVAQNDSFCQGPRTFTRKAICQFCWQTHPEQYECIERNDCPSPSSSPYYTTNCTVFDEVICLGHRTFYKNMKCKSTRQYNWWLALTLGITLGGFGADRFYLGYWEEGLGKLFTFGGLGIWTLADVVLIATGYLGPADGSVYT